MVDEQETDGRVAAYILTGVRVCTDAPVERRLFPAPPAVTPPQEPPSLPLGGGAATRPRLATSLHAPHLASDAPAAGRNGGHACSLRVRGTRPAGKATG